MERQTTTNTSCPILVVGAGPAGLAFALECARRGLKVRIIDKRPGRGNISKATGVSLGTMELLGASGLCPDQLTGATPMSRFVFYDDGATVSDLRVPALDGQPPAWLFPQRKLECLMEDALAERGIAVEYGCAFEGIIDNGPSSVSVVLSSSEERPPPQDFHWVVGADGAHSTVREATGLAFRGCDYPEEWSVCEVATSSWPADIQARLYLQSNGIGLFLSNPMEGIVQGILNAPDVAGRVREILPDCAINYERGFRVSLRRVTSPRHGRVWLIGDAAHVQSPVGGQGLNLAVWDGVTLARGLAHNDTSVERKLASRAATLLRFTHFDYRMLSTHSTSLRLLRNGFWRLAARHPRMAKWFFRLVSGAW